MFRFESARIRTAQLTRLFRLGPAAPHRCRSGGAGQEVEQIGRRAYAGVRPRTVPAEPATGDRTGHQRGEPEDAGGKRSVRFDRRNVSAKTNPRRKKHTSKQDAFSLLAYSNPWSSPLGWQLCPSRRETICAALNSAILGENEPSYHSCDRLINRTLSRTESLDYSWRPPLENCLAHSAELLNLMACSSIGACAFASVEDVLHSVAH